MVKKTKSGWIPFFCAVSAAVFLASLPLFAPRSMTLGDWPYFLGAALCTWVAWRIGKRMG